MSRKFKPGHDWYQIFQSDSHVYKSNVVVGSMYSCRNCKVSPVIRKYSDDTSLTVCARIQGIPASCDEVMVAEMMKS